jgi:hypothetical protein
MDRTAAAWCIYIFGPWIVFNNTKPLHTTDDRAITSISNSRTSTRSRKFSSKPRQLLAHDRQLKSKINIAAVLLSAITAQEPVAKILMAGTDQTHRIIKWNPAVVIKQTRNSQQNNSSTLWPKHRWSISSSTVTTAKTQWWIESWKHV